MSRILIFTALPTTAADLRTGGGGGGGGGVLINRQLGNLVECCE